MLPSDLVTRALMRHYHLHEVEAFTHTAHRDWMSTWRRAGGYETYAFVADLYDWVVPYRERPDIDFFVEAAKDAGSPVLEVGCGTGRVLIPSARAGVDIVGLDLSAPHARSLPGTASTGESRGPVQGPTGAGGHARLRPGATVHPGHVALSPFPTSHHGRRAACRASRVFEDTWSKVVD